MRVHVDAPVSLRRPNSTNSIDEIVTKSFIVPRAQREASHSESLALLYALLICKRAR
jgi:hypothetical protein